MKVAVAITSNYVSQHFGHCEFFKVYDVENNQIKGEGTIQNPEHQPGFLPGFLARNGVNVIIAGGMGGRAKELFEENNIEVFVGVDGTAQDAINLYLSGNIKTTESFCDHNH